MSFDLSLSLDGVLAAGSASSTARRLARSARSGCAASGVGRGRVFVAASVVSSALLIRGHLNHFTKPIVQSKVSLRLLTFSYNIPAIYLNI